MSNEKRHVPTAEEGYESLRGHVVDRALHARQRHGPRFDGKALRALLADAECVRFPTRLVFDAQPLLPGEFAYPRPRGEQPDDGFDLVVHPHFAAREDDLPLLVAYHIVSINYLDVATHAEAELYGATLMGMEVDDYYGRVCALADEIGAAQLTRLDVPGWEELATDAPVAGSPSAGCGPGCGCVSAGGPENSPGNPGVSEAPGSRQQEPH